MLLGLRVKNSVLIREVSLLSDIGFAVLPGETGAGKSILIDLISTLLSAKTGQNMIQNGEEAAYLELTLPVWQKELRERLTVLSIVPEENRAVIVSQKIQKTRSISRTDGEAVTARQLRGLVALLINIHGQHEVQTLFSIEMHGRLLDELLPPAGQAAREAYAEAYRVYRQLLWQERESTDRAAPLREADLLAFEIRGLSESGIHLGEETELAEAYASAKYAAQIEEAFTEAECALRTDAVSEAFRMVRTVVRYATSLEAFVGQLTEFSALVQDAAEAVRGGQGKVGGNEEMLNRLGEWLDLLRHPEAKYDCNEEGLLRLLKQKEVRATAITAFLRSVEAVTQQKESARQTLCAAVAALREFRHRAAESLAMQVEIELAALNFEGTRFEVRFAELADLAESVEFYIRTSPGEEIKSLRQAVSGGELSRVMLVLQTVSAAKDRVETLIFDEIDVGISGRTAQLVSGKLMETSRTRQVFCIMHFPQFTVMTNHHYLITEETDGSKTETEIRETTGEALYLELGWLIGGAEITAGVLKTTEEMKQLAEKRKEEMR